MSNIKYDSKYTDKKVSAAQVVTEKICESIARKNKKVLPIKFWELPEYNKIFKRQIIAANKLLKVFSCEAIIKALSDPQTKWMYSLSIPNLIPFIEKYQKELESHKTIDIKPSDITQKPRPVTPHKNILDKLDEY